MKSGKKYIIYMIRKGVYDLELDKEGLSITADNYYVLVQDRITEKWTYNINSGKTYIKGSIALTRCRIWKDNKIIFDFTGSKYIARYQAIKFLESEV